MIGAASSGAVALWTSSPSKALRPIELVAIGPMCREIADSNLGESQLGLTVLYGRGRSDV